MLQNTLSKKFMAHLFRKLYFSGSADEVADLEFELTERVGDEETRFAHHHTTQLLYGWLRKGD